jgi:glycine C-acetyltransferase
MPGTAIEERVARELERLRAAGTERRLRHLTGATGPVVQVEGRGEVLLLCSNDYLGLANHPQVVRGAAEALRRYGAGTASVRFICGTLDLHRTLEGRLAAWVGAEAALTYASCWNANEGLLPTLLAEGDAVFSDELNHASIIDACRLARGVQRVIYRHGDMADLEAKLAAHAGARARVIVTDGVFSMEGDLADLPTIAALAERYDALVVVDDSHGLGVLGATGRGTAEHFGLLGRIDVLTGTMGKALGGAAGGFVAASRTLIDYLIQRSRPQLFSNALPPAVAGAALAALDVLEREPERVRRLRDNANYLRQGLRGLGFRVPDTPAAILPIVVGDTASALAMAERLWEQGVFVVGFGYPVVPEGAARLRVQVSAAHTREHLDRALEAFARLPRPG